MKNALCAAMTVCFGLIVSASTASDLKTPEANETPPIVSTDSLKIVDLEGNELVAFSQDDVEAMETRKLTTGTPWTEGKVTFSGVDGKTLLKKAGFEGASVTAIALDDYAISLDWKDFEEHNALIATRMDGERITAGNKGPFWIVFDYDGIQVGTEAGLISKSVWHLVELEIE